MLQEGRVYNAVGFPYTTRALLWFRACLETGLWTLVLSVVTLTKELSQSQMSSSTCL